MSEQARSVGWRTDYLPRSLRFDARVAISQTPRAQLSRVEFCSPCLSVGEGPSDAYVFALSDPRGKSSRLGGEIFDSETIGILRPGVGHEFLTEVGDQLLLLTVSREMVEREALARWGQTLSEANAGSTFNCRGQRAVGRIAARWTRLLNASVRRPEILEHSATVRQLEGEFPSELLGAIAPPMPRAATRIRHRAARRAEAYVRENMLQPILLGDLCRVANANERTLREGFVELYGLSPLPYLKSLRFRRARSKLRKDGCDRQISDIALDCGFTHIGRFSVEYRRTFGETPSETQRDQNRRRSKTKAKAIEISTGAFSFSHSDSDSETYQHGSKPDT